MKRLKITNKNVSRNIFAIELPTYHLNLYENNLRY